MTDSLTQLKPLVLWTREDAKTIASSDLPDTYRVAKRMVEQHDYWQDGVLWPAAGTGKLAYENLQRIKPQHVPDPLIEEIVTNRSDGVFQREPVVTFDAIKPALKDSPAEVAQKQRAEKVLLGLARWWDNKKFWQHARKAFDKTAYSRRAGLRVGIAPGNLLPTERTALDVMLNRTPAPVTPSNLSMADAFDILEITAPEPDTARVYSVPDTRRPAAVITETQIIGGQEKQRAEIWWTEGIGAAKRTVLRVLEDTGTTEFAALDLKGRLPLAEMRVDEIITDPVIKNQALLNFANTVLKRCLETAGFPQTFLGNVEPPGIWLTYPPQPGEGPPLAVDVSKPGNTPIYKHRVPWQFGFEAVSELVGLRTVERSGLLPNVVEKEGFSQPFVETRAPTDPTYVVTGKNELRATLYGQCHQRHLSNSSTAEASGLAYQQARAQFEAYLIAIKGEAERMIRDILEATLAYAALMAPELAGFLDEYRCVVNLHVTSGPVTALDIAAAVQMRDARLIATASAQSRVGVEDPSAEQTMILADPFMQLELSKKQAEAVAAWIMAQAERDTAAQLARMSTDDQRILAAGPPPEPTTEPGNTEGNPRPVIQAA